MTLTLHHLSEFGTLPCGGNPRTLCEDAGSCGIPMTDDPQSPVREGDVLAGRYVVERVLAVGGMGTVVAARHAQLGHKVALKFLTIRDPSAKESAIKESVQR